MLTTLKNAFKIKEIRQKILFTLGMLVVIRIGSQLPVPGVDTKFFSQWFAQQTGGAFSFFDAITGGSFLNMSILALNINPYITSSIIMQLLTIAIPKLEEMQRDGEKTAYGRLMVLGEGEYKEAQVDGYIRAVRLKSLREQYKQHSVLADQLNRAGNPKFIEELRICQELQKLIKEWYR